MNPSPTHKASCHVVVTGEGMNFVPTGRVMVPILGAGFMPARILCLQRGWDVIPTAGMTW